MYAEYWNYIVGEYNTNQYAQESTIQALWENYFSEMFNYKKILKEIDPQRSITIGSSQRAIPDIILRRNNQDIVDVELKKYGLSFSDDMENQLVSYMNQLHVSIGVLVCQKIYVYVYDYIGNKIKKLEIPFEKNNPDGIKFIELFQKDNFSKDAIEAFIDSKQAFEKNVEKIKSDISLALILKLLGEHFGKEYTNQEFEAALSYIEIKIKKTYLVDGNDDGNDDGDDDGDDDGGDDGGDGGTGIKDYSKYLFEGVWYKKCHLPAAVVKAYVRDNPTVTYNELEQAFPKKLQGSLGVFQTTGNAQRYKDFKKRFVTDQTIILQDGIAIWVCNQWGGSGTEKNIYSFISKAEFLGYKIEGKK